MLFQNVCVLTKTVIKIDSTKLQKDKRCILTQTASLKLQYVYYLKRRHIYVRMSKSRWPSNAMRKIERFSYFS